jgi:hypothetical protein
LAAFVLNHYLEERRLLNAIKGFPISTGFSATRSFRFAVRGIFLGRRFCLPPRNKKRRVVKRASFYVICDLAVNATNASLTSAKPNGRKSLGGSFGRSFSRSVGSGFVSGGSDVGRFSVGSFGGFRSGRRGGRGGVGRGLLASEGKTSGANENEGESKNLFHSFVSYISGF